MTLPDTLRPASLLVHGGTARSQYGENPLVGDWPYLWLDATYLKQREGGRIVSVAAIIAVAANTEGKREIVGLHIGLSEAETFWSAFLKSLVRRGLRGTKLVISDAHDRNFHHVDGRDPRIPQCCKLLQEGNRHRMRHRTPQS